MKPTNDSESPRPKPPSLADYLVRYDLEAIMDEARQDYVLATAGSPRRLDQKDIAARFRDLRPPPKAPDEPR